MNEALSCVLMSKTLDHLRITEFASLQAVLRRHLDSHGDWIEHSLDEETAAAEMESSDKGCRASGGEHSLSSFEERRYQSRVQRHQEKEKKQEQRALETVRYGATLRHLEEDPF